MRQVSEVLDGSFSSLRDAHSEFVYIWTMCTVRRDNERVDGTNMLSAVVFSGMTKSLSR